MSNGSSWIAGNAPAGGFERLYILDVQHDPTVDDTPERALDEYLVSLSQAGSSEALDGLARRWTPRLLRYAARVLGGFDSAEAARDVVQETWIGAIRGCEVYAIPRSSRRGSTGSRLADAQTRSGPTHAAGASTCKRRNRPDQWRT